MVGYGERIVSCSPNLTEILVEMGFEKDIVGVSVFCPLNLPKVADVKINWEEVLKLKPSSVFMLSSQKSKKGIELLKKINIKFGTYSFENLKDIPFCAQEIAQILGKKEIGKKHFNNFMFYLKNIPKFENKKAIYVLWWKPLILSTNSNYISETLNFMGFDMLPKNSKKGFEKYRIENLFDLNPDIIFISDDAGRTPEIIKENFQIYYLPSKLVNRPNLTFLKYFFSFKNEAIFN